MSPMMKQYQERAARDGQARLDRLDPEKMFAGLKLQGVKVTKIQMRTLLFDDRAQLERLRITNPELPEVFILLVREDLEKPTLDKPAAVGESN